MRLRNKEAKVLPESYSNNRTAPRSAAIKECIEQMLDELEEVQVIEGILDIIEEKGVVINEFRSVKEVEEYLKQEADNWYSKQLTRTQSEHSYASSPLTNATSCGHGELSDEGYISPCEEVVELNPSSKIYNLRGIKKLKEENCICYK